ncbi:MAG: hypothetical protein BGO37_13690 [Cellulomonas sp. 73-92]|uniref:sugar kinase n=1 Tax=Cellulomonas sp. 73-92 TaxID=1895740 RepID=UPI00092BC4D5|nr:sugar kinase [Cellulomonas sp. 73-92]OJV83033.1 MAG: hypothetical protein BGO37_13690 [Cellulomonas sp. 73-92]
MTARLLCIGEILVEMVADEVDQSNLAPGGWRGPYPSGAPAILADQAALCGAEVSLVGSVGADDFGAACLARLRASGVGLDRVRVDETGTTGVAFVSYRSSGERSFVFHLPETASGRFRLTEPEAALGGVDCVHLMGSSAFSPAAVEALLEVDAAAAALGVRTSFDPNLRPEMLNRPEYVAALRRILGRAWLVLASEGELPALLGDGTDARCAARLLAGGAELVVVKRGAAGASLFRRGADEVRVPGLAVDEVDPTGAGDCFGGTFLALHLGGMDAAEALRYANVAGAMAVTRRGPMSGNRTFAELQAVERSLTPA